MGKPCHYLSLPKTKKQLMATHTDEIHARSMDLPKQQHQDATLLICQNYQMKPCVVNFADGALLENYRTVKL